MSGRCVGLMIALRDSSRGLEGSKALEIADEIEMWVVCLCISPNMMLTYSRIIIHIDRKVKEWASWPHVKSFLQQKEIKDGIARLHKDIDGAMMKFSVSSHLLFYP